MTKNQKISSLEISNQFMNYMTMKSL